MAKKVAGFVKLQIPAGQATPAPPVGTCPGGQSRSDDRVCAHVETPVCEAPQAGADGSVGRCCRGREGRRMTSSALSSARAADAEHEVLPNRPGSNL